MKVTYFKLKRDWTLKERELDFEDAKIVFLGYTIDIVDERKDYGEKRIISFGMLNDRMVVVGWTPRGEDRHVFTMRKANDREQKRFAARLAGN